MLSSRSTPRVAGSLRGSRDVTRRRFRPVILRNGAMDLSLSSAGFSSWSVAGARTGLRVSGDELMGRTTSLTSWVSGDRTAAMNSLRFLSSTTAKYLAKGKDGEKGPLPPAVAQEHASESSQPPPPPSPPQPKGIRKVLPSLTPHENIYTVPNLLTFSRLVAAPFIGYAILHDAHTLALGLFAYAGVSDLLDGWIARRWKLQTVVGSVVDPMADKLLMTVLTVCLAMQGSLPVWLATIILGRDVGLGISAIYYRWISLPPPKTFTRYWDFSLPSAEVRPTTISKYNTFLQLGLMGATMVAPVMALELGTAMTAFQYLVATTTVWSGLSYVFSKDAVRILSENKEQKSKDP
ncbi:CDP-alcohol phosphatidyltransferase-domain-containing protein [Xylaria arbuscula]|nr:CDP-alcohol phosphatidyltransferase-domain-containing protein [Xylaria arbuscula]